MRNVGDEICSLRRLYTKSIWEVVNTNSVQRTHTIFPVIAERKAFSADHFEPGTINEFCSNFKTRRINDAIHRILDPIYNDTALRDALNAFAIGIQQNGRGVVERL